MIGLLSLMIEGHEGSDSELNRIVIVSQATLFTEPRKGLVMLQPSNCHHDRNLSGPIRSAFFIDRICCHGVQLRHNVFSGCQRLIT